MLELFRNPIAPIIRSAMDEAVSLGSPVVEAEHLLLALATRDRETIAFFDEVRLDHSRILEALDEHRAAALRAVGVSDTTYGSFPPLPVDRARLRFGASSKRALERASKIAYSERARSIRGRHLLLALLRSPHGTVCRALTMAGIDLEALRESAAKKAAAG